METAEAIKGAAKSPEAFRTISEASAELGVPQHVLRFWETKFSFIRPMKRAGGRRFYRRQDIAVLKGVRTLLHEGGYTIKGVQRLHREQGVRLLVEAGEGDLPPPAAAMRALEGEHADEERFEAPPVQAADMAILQADTRLRLDGVLRDIDRAKAAIDDLLAARED